MSLMDNEIENLTEAPNCPRLQTLFLNRNYQLKVIHNDFFQFMSRLKVLSLSENRGITELPVGISKLVSLEYLDLSSTRIRELPIEMKALEKLKCLNLECLGGRITIPRGLISAFSKLQVLRMRGTYPFDEAVDDNSECLAEELQSLNHLKALTVSVTSDFALYRILTAKSLLGCIEWIGLGFLRDSKQLNISSFGNIKSLRYIMVLMDCQGLEEVKAEWEIQNSVIATEPCFKNLVTVIIYRCSKLKDITWVILAPNLRYLYVIYCDKMEEIISETKLSQVTVLVGTLNPFAELESLYLAYLPELRSIYRDALPFSCIKEVTVEKCPKLRRLPLNSNSAKGKKISLEGEEQWWQELQWDDESSRNAFHCNLHHMKRLQWHEIAK
ncbi:hypothetical protein DITRI_Ditri19aG0125600 [Diplodiscus trichospermus]